MKMTNQRNQVIYRLWAPMYDALLDRFFLPGRQQGLNLLNLKGGEKILIVGAGTGADLPLLPEGVEVVCVELSSSMLKKAGKKLPISKAKTSLIQADAQTMIFNPGTFDIVLLNLILSVVPDAGVCLQNAIDSLKPGGRAVIFDKFMRDHRNPSLGRRLVNVFSTMFGTDITRKFSEIYQGSRSLLIHDQPSLLRGMYRVILLQKPE